MEGQPAKRLDPQQAQDGQGIFQGSILNVSTALNGFKIDSHSYSKKCRLLEHRYPFPNVDNVRTFHQ